MKTGKEAQVPKSLEEQLQEQIQAKNVERARTCLGEINNALKRHNCALQSQVSFEIGPDGTLKVVAKPVVGALPTPAKK